MPFYRPQVRNWAVIASLRHRNFRLMWLGTLISNTGDWLDSVALAWMVMELTGSPLALGLVYISRGVPIVVLTIVGGAVADRMDRRRMMMLAQSAAMVLATALAVLALTGTPPIWSLMLIAALRGCAVAFSLPARHSLIPALVPRDDLANAVALNVATINLTKVLGPLIAGFVIAAWGTGVCFMLNAVSFTAVLGTLAAMRFPQTAPRDGETESVGAAILAGVRFIRNDRIILALVSIALLPTLIGLPYINMLGIYAYQTDWGPVGLGILTGATAGGSVLGALIAAGNGASTTNGRIMLILLGMAGLALVIFAVNPVDLLAPVFLVAVGGLFVAYSSVHATLLQLAVPDAFRGRVLSTLYLSRGLVSVGAGIFAALAEVTSIQIAYATMGLGVLVFAAFLWHRMPELRQLKL